MHQLLELVTPLERLEFDTQNLMSMHPPVWEHRNKEAVFNISSPAGCEHQGRLLFTRWPAMSLPETVDLEQGMRALVGSPDVYTYSPVLHKSESVEWHVNFADPHLFCAYGSELMAQDELQVAEHPSLGAVRQALESGGHVALTLERSVPTPALIMGVERRCSIATDSNEQEDRPNGLYGNSFGDADVEVVRRATRALNPPTLTNLIAMSAPAGGIGRYDLSQIERILVTAYTGFRAACMEADRASTITPDVAIHTGFWGCGAYGGNRLLMTILQIAAADMAGVDRLVFHTVNDASMGVLSQAKSVLRAGLISGGEMDTREFSEYVYSMGLEWGLSNGT